MLQLRVKSVKEPLLLFYLRVVRFDGERFPTRCFVILPEPYWKKMRKYANYFSEYLEPDDKRPIFDEEKCVNTQ